MNKKIIIAVAAVLVVAIAGGAGFYAGSNKNKETTTASTSESTSETTTELTTEQTSTEVSSETVSVSTTKEDPNAFLYNGYWYIFDDDKVCAYALKFDKGGSVAISYFNTETVKGFDPQYYKNGKAKYQLKNNKIKITNIPDECEIETIELEVRDSKTINYLGVDGVRKDDLKLDYPFSYFNAK